NVADVWEDLATEVSDAMGEDLATFRWLASLRIKGQESTLDVELDEADVSLLPDVFRDAYRRTFGYAVRGDRVIEVVTLRVIGESRIDAVNPEVFGDSFVEGPIVVQDCYSTCVVPAGWRMVEGGGGTMMLEHVDPGRNAINAIGSDAVVAGLFRSRFEGLLSAMGEALKRTAVSTNVKDRMDYSCGLLNADGYLVSSAPHVPVHLGALGVCVREVCREMRLNPGDVVITNDPGAGGSHLPDVTVIAPVHASSGVLIGYVANRAHHAELGGLAPGSMPAAAGCLAEEGVVIRPMKLVEAGEPRLDLLESLLRESSYPSRRPEDNLADAEAQLAACHFARDALLALADEYGVDAVKGQLDDVLVRSARLMENRLSQVSLDRVAVGTLDDGSEIRVALRTDGPRLNVDFSGSAEEHPGNLNATPAIVRSVLLYSLRLWLGDDVPLNEGLLESVELRIPRGMLNPDFSGTPEVSPAVVGGNVETSQRIADLLLDALEVSANGPGTMNNFLFGDDGFGYYETLAGGAGAGPRHRGASGRHVHMTNTALTDPELMEQRYPVRVVRHAIRRGSGGKGMHDGGDGVLREIEFEKPVTVSFLTQRRTTRPEGSHGGGDGMSGRQVRIHPDGTEEELDGVVTYQAGAGERVRIETPGGGGWGEKD
ncbi:MAG: hydantoinase B/oxoprolinase family protein, partial [Haloferula sp.]